MANLRPLPRLRRINRELANLCEYVALHSGVPEGQEKDIENESAEICESAIRLVGLAMRAQGADDTTLVRTVRHTLFSR